MYQITTDTITRLKEDGYDVWTISLYEAWLQQMPRLEKAKERVRSSFRDMRLDDGMGLREADAMDSYADAAGMAAARKLIMSCTRFSHWYSSSDINNLDVLGITAEIAR